MVTSPVATPLASVGLSSSTTSASSFSPSDTDSNLMDLSSASSHRQDNQETNSDMLVDGKEKFERVVSKVSKTPKTSRKTLGENPRMCILDFKEEVSDSLKLVRTTLTKRGNLRNCTLRKLERGGVSILFSSKGQKAAFEGILRDDLKAFLAPKKSWVDVKEVYELIVSGVPLHCDENEFKTFPGIVKVLRMHTRVVLFCDSLKTAQDYLQTGFDFENFFFLPSPFTFKPKVACPNCGSLEHQHCEIKKCLKCGDTSHVAENCQNVPTCVRCGDTKHTSWNCPEYVARSKKAHTAKKKSYAEALGIAKPSGSSVIRQQPTNQPQISRYAEVVPQQTTPAISFELMLKLSLEITLSSFWEQSCRRTSLHIEKHWWVVPLK